MDEQDLKSWAATEATSAWQKLKAAVVSAPMTFLYGAIAGGIVGAIFF